MCCKGMRVVVISALVVLTACSRGHEVAAELPPPVKVEQVGGSGVGAMNTFVGTVRARQRTELSFESGGRIASMNVDVGDHVRAGQVLAQLDRAPAQARLAKAEADRQAASAALADREAQLMRTRQLERDHVVSAAATADARTLRDVATGQLQAADAAVVLARRDLTVSQIRAPYDGQIVARLAQPFADVAAAQAVLQIEDGRALEIVVWLPDTVATRLPANQRVRVEVPGGASDAVTARLDKRSARADNGAQVQATFVVEGKLAALRTGTTVSVALPVSEGAGLTIPASALLPDVQAGKGKLFVWDEGRQRLKLRDVSIAALPVHDGRLQVNSGLRSGEWVAVAGVPFLVDGQAAIRFEPQTRLQGDAP